MMDSLDTIIAVLPVLTGGVALMLIRGPDRARSARRARMHRVEHDGREALEKASPPNLAANS